MNARNQQGDLDPERDKHEGITREQITAINREPSLYPQLMLENQRRAIITAPKAKPTKPMLNHMAADPRKRAEESNAGKDKPWNQQQVSNKGSTNNTRRTAKILRRQAARDLRSGASRSRSRMATEEVEMEDDTNDGESNPHQLLQPSRPSKLSDFPYPMPKPWKQDGSEKPTTKTDKLERNKERNIEEAMGKEGVLAKDPPSWLLWRHDPNLQSQLPQFAPITSESRSTKSHKQDNMSAQQCAPGCTHNTFFHDRSQKDWATIDSSYELVFKAQDVRVKHWAFCLTR